MFGSRFINKLGWRDTWVFISKKRDHWLAESYQKSSSFHNWGSSVIANATIELQEKIKDCLWANNDSVQRRKQFCAKYEGYGALCSCKSYRPLLHSYKTRFLSVSERLIV